MPRVALSAIQAGSVDCRLQPDQAWFNTKTVNIQSAKTHFFRLVEEAVAGEEIILAKAGKPLVRLTPVRPGVSRRRPGAWKGRVKMAGDFNAEDDAITALFEGRQIPEP